MATKKTSKNVIDYDPLAWLNEETEQNGTAQQDNDSAKAGKVTAQASKKKADANAIEQDGNVETESENAAYGFFSDEETPSAAPEDTAAFGFFDEEDQVTETEVAAADSGQQETTADPEEGSAYGFFDDTDALTTQAARLDGDNNVINLGADLTIRSVGACKELIDQSLSNGFDVRIAAGELQKIDSAGLQLIYTLKTTLEKTAQSIHWESTSNIINDAAKIIGMPRLCDADDSDPGFGFFEDDNVAPSTADSSADDGYGFF